MSAYRSNGGTLVPLTALRLTQPLLYLQPETVARYVDRMQKGCEIAPIAAVALDAFDADVRTNHATLLFGLSRHSLRSEKDDRLDSPIMETWLQIKHSFHGINLGAGDYPVCDFHFKWAARSHGRRGNAFGSITRYFVLAGVISDTSLIIVDAIFELRSNGTKFRLGVGGGAKSKDQIYCKA